MLATVPISPASDLAASSVSAGGAPASGTIRRLRVLLAVSLIVPFLLVGAALWQERRVLVDEAGRRTERSAEVLEQHAAAAFHAYELIFARVDEHLRANPGEGEAALHIYLATIDHGLKEVGSLFLADASGRVTAHSRFYPVATTNVRDRDYFRMLSMSTGMPVAAGESILSLDASGLAIGAPNTGRLSGTTKLNIARATTTADGRFSGAIGISVAQEYFEAFHRTLAGSAGDSMALVRADGTVLARSPALTPDQLRQASSPENQQAVVGRLAQPKTAFTSSLDGVERVASFRKLADYPIYVGFGLGMAGVLAAWYGHILVYGGVALLAALSLCSVTWLALRAAQEEALARASLVGEMGRRAAAEAALRQAQKMEAVGQLTGGIAHDFNNLLAVVLGNLELLAKRLPDPSGRSDEAHPSGNPTLSGDPRLRRYVEGALEGARRGAALTQRMLAFSRRQELKFEAVDLATLVRGMTNLMTRSIGPTVAIEVRFPAQLPPARVDLHQLEAALLNLAVNARDAMPKGGTITVGGRAATLPEAAPGLSAGRYVVLAVADTGEGMDAATLARAAEPFFTTKPVGKGTGLGLAMVHGLAAQSGGTLRVASEPGRGTTIELWLPVADDVVATVAAVVAPVPARAEAGSCRVLLVDDDALVLDNTAALLDDLGYQVIRTDSAGQALEVLRLGTPVDLVVTDQMMAGMTGVEMAAEVARLRPGLPVLLASGFADLATADLDRLPRLSKPFTQGALAQAIADATRAGRPDVQDPSEAARSSPPAGADAGGLVPAATGPRLREWQVRH